MVAKVAAPAFVKALPASVRTMVRQQCGGDWRRVTLDPDGGIVVHNTPQCVAEPAPPPPVPPARVTPATITTTFRPGRTWNPPGYVSIGREGIMTTPRSKPTARKRSGVPRTTIELTKRMLDMGVQFVRVPGGLKARTYYLGYHLDSVWVVDNTPRSVIRANYRRIRQQVREIDAHFAREAPGTDVKRGAAS